MNDHDHEEIRRALRDALPPVDTGLRRDLWPLMQRRLDGWKQPMTWYDWALVGLVGGVIVVFPDLILALVYHF
jgi:hypothetical protein